MTVECKNKALLEWVEEVAGLCKPENVVWCNGSREEYNGIMKLMVDAGIGTPLNKRPESYLFRSDPTDVARIESHTYVSTKDEEDAGPNNNWVDPDELKRSMTSLYDGCMKGRTMYVIPFSMGPIGSPLAKTGVEITDSPYVVVNMHIMTRVGDRVIEALGSDGDFYPCLHSVGAPLEPGQQDVPWPCAPMEEKYISHFPEEKLVWSYGSGYGGNALLGKKCLSLRIASTTGKREGWLAEHMMILRLTNPEGRQYHIAGAFPSACGKTNLAMITPTMPGWTAETIGDDICWMKIMPDGRFHAINPEMGFFGVAPGTSKSSNPVAMEMVRRKTIFTNCALTDDGDVWWEDMGIPAPEHAIDWKGRDWAPENEELAAHPNARFTSPLSECRTEYDGWDDPDGVPIDIIIFGGRRAEMVPLVHESMDWDHGVFMGVSASSETTSAIIDKDGNLMPPQVRRDPFAMLPFCGYNMGDYFQHWFEMGDRVGDKAPRIFYVNWFRKDGKGRFLWPGFGDNSRILEWMCDRVDGKAGAIQTPIGLMPEMKDLDLKGVDISTQDMEKLLEIDVQAWSAEVDNIEEFLVQYGDHYTDRLRRQVQGLRERLKKQ